MPREHRGTRLADPNGPNWHFTVAMLMLAASPWFLSTSHLVLLIRADCVLSPQAAVGAKLEADERMSQFDEESRESGASSSLDNLSALASFAVSQGLPQSGSKRKERSTPEGSKHYVNYLVVCESLAVECRPESLYKTVKSWAKGYFLGGASEGHSSHSSLQAYVVSRKTNDGEVAMMLGYHPPGRFRSSVQRTLKQQGGKFFAIKGIRSIAPAALEGHYFDLKDGSVEYDGWNTPYFVSALK